MIDSSGKPHIAYSSFTDGKVKYAAWSGTEWDIQTLYTSGENAYMYKSLALDNYGNPHISFYDQTNSELKYATLKVSGWNLEAVCDAWYGGENGTSIAVDAANNAHIRNKITIFVQEENCIKC